MIKLDAAINHLNTDPTMAELIKRYDPPTWRQPHEIDIFTDVISAIISQQLSVKVADIIESRVYSLLRGQKFTPEAMADLDPELIRSCGVSYAKIRYIKAAAQAHITGQIKYDDLIHKSDEDVITDLISIHGIGKWTAEMLLISSLHRPDVFSIGDLGLRTAVSQLYLVDRSDLPGILTISAKWSPYRTIASKYLWKSLDNSPTLETSSKKPKQGDL